MKEKILENDSFTMFKTDETKYEILDKKGSLVLGLNGNYTKEQLKEQFDNCSSGCIII